MPHLGRPHRRDRADRHRRESGRDRPRGDRHRLRPARGEGRRRQHGWRRSPRTRKAAATRLRGRGGRLRRPFRRDRGKLHRAVRQGGRRLLDVDALVEVLRRRPRKRRSTWPPWCGPSGARQRSSASARTALRARRRKGSDCAWAARPRSPSSPSCCSTRRAADRRLGVVARHAHLPRPGRPGPPRTCSPPAWPRALQTYPLDFLPGTIAADMSFAKVRPRGRHSHSWHVGEEILELAGTERLRAFGYIRRIRRRHRGAQLLRAAPLVLTRRPPAPSGTRTGRRARHARRASRRRAPRTRSSPSTTAPATSTWTASSRRPSSASAPTGGSFGGWCSSPT